MPICQKQRYRKKSKLVHITQVNSGVQFARSDWLLKLWILCYLPPSKTKWLPTSFCPFSSQNKITVWGWLFTCVVYTKTIIHLSVGEKWRIFTSPLCRSVNIHHYSPPLRWIIVHYEIWSSNFENNRCLISVIVNTGICWYDIPCLVITDHSGRKSLLVW